MSSNLRLSACGYWRRPDRWRCRNHGFPIVPGHPSPPQIAHCRQRIALCPARGVEFAGLRCCPTLAEAIWETVGVSELRRLLLNAGRVGELFFCREREWEVDFVIHHGGRITLAEPKWTELPDQRAAANLRKAASQWPKNSVLLY